MIHSAASGSVPSAGHARSLDVHLGSLRDFAAELRGQINALTVLRSSAAALADQTVLLGDFTEAHLLVSRQSESIAQLQKVLDGIEDALTFAEEVTDTVADAYQRADAQVAESFHGLGSSGTVV